MNPVNISNRCGLRAIDSTGQYLAIGGGAGDQVRICNVGGSAVCVLDGDGTQTAVFPTDNATANGAGTPIPAGNTEIFSMKLGGTLHFICAAGTTTTIYASRGLGE